MNNIEWKDGAVCAIKEMQFFTTEKDGIYSPTGDSRFGVSSMFFDGDESFCLNEIQTGDYIEASELDNEQKYDDVVEVFELFGFILRGEFKSLSVVNDLGNKIHDAFICIRQMGSYNSTVCLATKLELSSAKSKRKLTYSQIIAIGKLKRMMLEREKSAVKSGAKSGAVSGEDFTKVSSNKYEREITDRQGNSATVDVYDVLKAFDVTCPATQHAVKKLLCSGLRGHKDLQTDLLEAKESIVRAIELNG